MRESDHAADDHLASLLVHRQPRKAVKAAARRLNALACGNRRVPLECKYSTAHALPPLLPLPADAEVLERAGAPMVVLLRGLCELGHPELSLEALHSCYHDVCAAPYAAVCQTVAALGHAAMPREARALGCEWALAQPPPRDCTPSRRLDLLRLLLLRVLATDAPAAAREVLDECRASRLLGNAELSALDDAVRGALAPPADGRSLADDGELGAAPAAPLAPAHAATASVPPAAVMAAAASGGNAGQMDLTSALGALARALRAACEQRFAATTTACGQIVAAAALAALALALRRLVRWATPGGPLLLGRLRSLCGALARTIAVVLGVGSGVSIRRSA